MLRTNLSYVLVLSGCLVAVVASCSSPLGDNSHQKDAWTGTAALNAFVRSLAERFDDSWRSGADKSLPNIFGRTATASTQEGDEPLYVTLDIAGIENDAQIERLSKTVRQMAAEHNRIATCTMRFYKQHLSKRQDGTQIISRAKTPWKSEAVILRTAEEILGVQGKLAPSSSEE